MKHSKQAPNKKPLLSLRDIARTTAALLDGKFLPLDGYNSYSPESHFLDAQVSEIGSVISGGKSSEESIYLITTADKKHLSIDDLQSFLFPVGQVLLVQFAKPGSYVSEITFQVATQDFMDEIFLAEHVSKAYRAIKELNGEGIDVTQPVAVLRKGR